MQYKKAIAAITAAALLYLPAGMEAKESHFESDSEEIEDNYTRPTDVHADDWFSNPSKREDYGSDSGNSDPDAIDTNKKQKSRYLEICRDDSFIYSMDRKTAHFTRIPQTIDEKMIDVWIRLDPLDIKPGEYSTLPKYYLEHYLLRLKREQIQFLCEMEITDRPRNDIEEKRYDPRMWERLVPGSIEETIYHAIMENKGKIRDESKSDGSSVRDYIENTFNISL